MSNIDISVKYIYFSDGEYPQNIKYICPYKIASTKNVKDGLRAWVYTTALYMLKYRMLLYDYV